VLEGFDASGAPKLRPAKRPIEPGPAGRSPGSLCWAGLFNTYFWIDPTRRVTGTIMTQVLPFVDNTVMHLYDQLERGVYNALQSA
jgi:methyl acetate hydrolase